MDIFECRQSLDTVGRDLRAFYPSIVSTWHRLGNAHVSAEFIKRSVYHSLLAGWAIAQSDIMEATRGCYGTIWNQCFAHCGPCQTEPLHSKVEVLFQNIHFVVRANTTLIMLTNKPTLFTQQSKYEHPNVYMSLNIIMNQRQLEILWSYVFQFDF